jgi:hypothetical protein
VCHSFLLHIYGRSVSAGKLLYYSTATALILATVLSLYTFGS